MNAELADRVVLLTGASGGIGMATARAFAAEGAALILQYRSSGASLKELASTFDTETLITQADVSEEDSVSRLFAEALSTFPRIDTVVVNAGIWPAQAMPIERMTLAHWRSTIDVNLTGAFLTCREFFRHLRNHPREDPSVVLIASTAGLYGEEGHVDYAASKAATAYGLTLTLKNEIVRLAPRGRVNAICPGWVDTPMAAEPMTVEGAVGRATSTMSLRKIATAEDVAKAIVFLSSTSLAGHLSGTILPLAGGMEGRLLHDPSTLETSRP